MSGHQLNGTNPAATPRDKIHLNTIEEALEDIRSGKLIIVVDDDFAGGEFSRHQIIGCEDIAISWNRTRVITTDAIAPPGCTGSKDDMLCGQFSNGFIIFCDGDFAVASGNAGQTALPVEDGDLD